MVLKSCSENKPFILCETSLVLKKDKCLSVENILKQIIELITSIIVILLTFTQFFQILIEKDMFRSSNQRCSVTKGVLSNFSKFTGKHLRQILFFNKVAGLLLINRLCHRCFPVNFEKFLRTPLLQNTSGLQLIKKEALQQVFSCEFCEILRTLFVTEHLRWLLLIL